MTRIQGWYWYGITVVLWAAAMSVMGTQWARAEDGFREAESGFAYDMAMLQPPADAAPQPQPKPAAGTPRVQPRPVPPQVARYRPSRFRLASVPNMFGDTLWPAGQVLVTSPLPGNGLNALADLALAGGSRRMKIAENNKAIPMDRVFFTYNHFENALDASYGPLVGPPSMVTSGPVDRYVLGFEKTFFDKTCSVDVRMPFVSRFNFAQRQPQFALTGDEIGNLHVNLKALLHTTECFAFAGGLGIDLPTGSDVSGSAQAVPFAMQNEAVYLMPFLGLVGMAHEDWFYHGFLEVGVPLSGNTVVAGNQTGILNEPTALNLDFAVGRWLVRRPCACVLTGIAAVAELHYTSTLSNGDQVAIPLNGINYNFSSAANGSDVVNATVGLHTELMGNTTLRVGGGFPLTDGTNRLFDAEVLVQLNRRF